MGVLNITLILSKITPVGLYLAPVLLIISIVLDVIKKRFYWSKFALIFLVAVIILLIIQIKLNYSLTNDVLNFSNQPELATFDSIKSFKQERIDEIGIYISVPEGWTKKVERASEDIENTSGKKEYILSLTQGKYQFTINTFSGTGRAVCILPGFEKDFVMLNNTYLGKSKVAREKETANFDKKTDRKMYICSDWQEKGHVEYGTAIGDIHYNLPAGWDSKALPEMDKIVESIRL